MKYKCVYVMDTVPAHTYTGIPIAGTKEFYELTRDEATVLASKMRGIDVLIEHHNKADRIGHVTAANVDEQGVGHAEFEIDTSTQTGRNAVMTIDSGICPAVSLRHNLPGFDPVELSIVAAGARPGTCTHAHTLPLM